ncbi:hypothetical protein TREPR_2440 [Treponema primitia ZAS-2]|uniref:Uncharacterized protein n=1 Tax=Treponema primitia (strain ATCC BAA-887 / DSM 12427 / ZAS-2) TaxID=545694 RepID=F5YHE2_TREPZ|nr:hypothetical protein TREPR_2440 [Treponema primitia ZAS-2]
MLFISGGKIYAQTAAEIDRILESPEISSAQAAGFVQMAAGLLPDSDFLSIAGSRTPIKLGELCFLIMKSFNLKGSFLYTLFPGPRYSYRELRYMRLLPEPSDPAMRVSGLQLMQIVERVLNYLESDEKAALALNRGAK